MNTFQPSGFSHSGPAYGTLGTLNPRHLGNVPTNNQTGMLVTTQPSKYGSLMSVVALVGSGVAAAISYKRNQSIPWAIGAFLIWPAALPYYYMTQD